MDRRLFYVKGETPRLLLRWLSLRRKPAAAAVQVAAKDYNGRPVDTGVLERTVQLKTAAETRLVWPLPVERLGPYSVLVTAGDERIGTSFSMIAPRAIPERADSTFAIHAVMRNPHYPRLAQQMGARWNRTWGSNISFATLWYAVEPEPGRWVWHDADIDLSLRHGMKVLGLLSGVRTAPRTPPRMPDWDEAALTLWDEYVRRTVKHYRGKVAAWEVLNEPYFAFNLAPGKYAALLRRTFKTVKKAAPDAIVVGTCGPPWSTKWYENTFAAGDYHYQDVVSAHLYPGGGGAHPLDADRRFEAFVAEVRKIMARHGDPKPLWDTETGIGPSESFVPDKRPRYFRTMAKPVPMRVETNMTARLCVAHEWTGVRYFYYILHGSFEYSSCLCEDHGTPLPAAAAWVAAQRLFAGAKPVAHQTIGHKVTWYVFDKSGRSVCALWGLDLRGQQPRLDLPIGPDQVTLFDVMGNPRPAAAGSSLKLSATQEPLYATSDSVPPRAMAAAFRKATVTGLAPVRAATRVAWHPIRGLCLAVDVENLTEKSLTFRLDAGARPGWRFAASPIAAKEWRVFDRRTIWLPLAAPPQGQPPTVSVAAAGASILTRPQAHVLCCRGGQARVDAREQVTVGPELWLGPASCSAVWAAEWENEALVLRVSVRDERIVPSSRPGAGDGVEMWLRRAPRTGLYDPAELPGIKVCAGPGRPVTSTPLGSAAEARVTGRVATRPKGYDVQVRVPAGVFRGPCPLLADLCLDDWDSPGAQRSRMCWTGGKPDETVELHGLILDEENRP